VLKTAIALHKQHRALILNGDFHRIDAPNYLNIVGVVAVDQAEALYSVAFLKGHANTLPNLLHVAGLDRAAHYRVRLVWPQECRSKSSPSVIEALDLVGGGASLSGEALMQVGLQLPLTAPETVLLFHFERAGQSCTPKVNVIR
jgi:alpha-galactosidase